jgi:hypothetical protein
MIVWRSGGDTINLGTLETGYCKVCERERPFNLILQYRYWGLYWIFNFIAEKKYMLLCDVCQRGWELESREVENELKSVPIPFMRRYGFLVFIAIIGIIILVSLGSQG